MKKMLVFFLALVISIAVFSSCDNKKEETIENTNLKNTSSKGTTASNADSDLEKTIVFETNMGAIEFKLFSDTPNASKNMIDKVNAGFYNNTSFNKIIPNYIIQCGNPENSNDDDNKLQLDLRPERNNDRGMISMASSSASKPIGYQSNSEFFINIKDNFQLNFSHLCPESGKQRTGSGLIPFAKIISGMDVCDKIAAVKTQSDNKPVDPVIIKRAYVK